MQEHLSANLARDPDYLDRLITETEAAGFIGYTIRALQGWRLRGGDVLARSTATGGAGGGGAT